MDATSIEEYLSTPRKPEPKWIGLNYNDYLKAYPDKYPFAAKIPNPLTKEEQELSYRISFIFDTIPKDADSKSEVIGVWRLYCDMANSSERISTIASDIDFCIHSLISLTKDAKLSKEETAGIMLELENTTTKMLEAEFSDKSNFSSSITDWILWQTEHDYYLKYLDLGYNYNELSFARNLYQNNLPEFELLKATSPSDYIRFIDIFKSIYKTFSQSNRHKFKQFYLKVALQQIIVSKNAGHFENYQTKLEDYYSESLTNKIANWLYKNLTGYGERPWRLVGLFFGVNVLFALIFCFLPNDFSSPSGQPPLKTLNPLYLFLIFLSFNNTTMLTVGYGDMYPTEPLARILVTVLQILGFLFSSSAIALFLRKLLRF